MSHVFKINNRLEEKNIGYSKKYNPLKIIVNCIILLNHYATI